MAKKKPVYNIICNDGVTIPCYRYKFDLVGDKAVCFYTNEPMIIAEAPYGAVPFDNVQRIDII